MDNLFNVSNTEIAFQYAKEIKRLTELIKSTLANRLKNGTPDNRFKDKMEVFSIEYDALIDNLNNNTKELIDSVHELLVNSAKYEKLAEIFV